MHLQFSMPFDPNLDASTLLEPILPRPAVFALHLLDAAGTSEGPPYLGRTMDLRRRLGRLLGQSRGISKLLNLREITRRIEYQYVGSPFEAKWLLYRLNKFYYADLYRQRLRLKSPALLKLNLHNRFPRCYPTRRLSHDGSFYYGPFPSRLAAERFAAEFLDFFKIRRCVEELNPDPAHPGCIYSQMHMCLAPCFAGCTDDDYQQEVARVVGFLDAEGQSLVRSLEAERAQAAQALEFELAAKLHHRLEKVHEVLRQRPGLVRNLRDLHAIVVLRGAEAKSAVFFRVSAGQLRGPVTLSLDENVPSPVPLDQQLHALLDPLVPPRDSRAALPSWEHLSLLARWYYSSFRQGELLMLPPNQEIPHARLIRLCRKVLAG
jgi:excinuclease ABC subunit C